MKESIPSLDAPPLAPGTSLSTVDYIRNYVLRLRSGEIGSWPMILGLIVIALIFQSQNQNFLTARNFVNLIVQMAGYTVIAIGVVYVLLVGEIDLSIGYVSAVAAVFMVLQLQDPPGWPWYAAVSVALMLAATIGILHGFIITTFQVPSFIVSLAALIAWNGTVLLLIGTSGTVIIQDNVIVGIANHFLEPALGWLVGIVTIVIFAFYQIQHWVVRRRQRLVDVPGIIVLMRIVLLAGLASGVVFICNQDRGVPFVGVLLLILLTGFTVLATKTRFGRYVYAIGDNKIAARRAGIDVKRVLITVFMISSLMAGAGGIVLASRLRSVDTAAGGGNLLLNSIAAAVIGGTSLFGGSGRVPNVLLGALVIASVENGMGLLRLDAGVQFIITGFVLLMAVLVDAVSRQNRRQPVQS